MEYTQINKMIELRMDYIKSELEIRVENEYKKEIENYLMMNIINKIEKVEDLIEMKFSTETIKIIIYSIYNYHKGYDISHVTFPFTKGIKELLSNIKIEDLKSELKTYLIDKRNYTVLMDDTSNPFFQDLIDMNHSFFKRMIKIKLGE